MIGDDAGGCRPGMEREVQSGSDAAGAEIDAIAPCRNESSCGNVDPERATRPHTAQDKPAVLVRECAGGLADARAQLASKLLDRVRLGD